MKKRSITILWLVMWVLAIVPSMAQTGITVPALEPIETDFKEWLDSSYGTLSASLAIAKDGRLVYARSFGKAELSQTTNAKPYHLYRIASMSKSITAMMILKLVDEGKLQLTDKVFGDNGILNDNYYYTTNPSIPVENDPWLYQITVQHLLENVSGLTQGHPHHTQMAAEFGEGSPISIRTYTKWIIRNKMEHQPNTHWEYNNSNFIVAAAIIEKKSGKSFSEYLSQILTNIGIYDVKAGRSLMMHKQEREAEYPKYPDDDPGQAVDYSYYGDNSLLPHAYGSNPYEIATGAGGVIGTPKDLVRLIAAVDNVSGIPQLLSPTSRQKLFEPGTIHTGYAKGWGVDTDGSFQHNGGGPCHMSCYGKLSDGWSWAVIVAGNETNFNPPGMDDPNLKMNIERDVMRILKTHRNIVAPNYNLFLTPTASASNLSVTPASGTSATISWTNGNGNKRLVIMRAGKVINQFPVDGSPYTGNASFGSGSHLDEKNYVVYNGTGNSVTVTNLLPGMVYHVRVVEYNQNSGTGDFPVYALAPNPVTYFTTTGPSSVSLNINSVNGSVSQTVAGVTHAIGTKVALTAVPSAGYMFSHWSGSVTGTQNPVELTMDANKTLTANFVTLVPKKAFYLFGNQGRVASSIPGLTFAAGTNVTLYAIDPEIGDALHFGWDNGSSAKHTSVTINDHMAFGPWWHPAHEAESASGQSSFHPYEVRQDATASGGQYIVVPNGFGNASSAPSNGRLLFEFYNENDDANEPLARYDIWAKVKVPSTSDNNVYVRVNGNSFSDRTLPVSSSWAWVKLITQEVLPNGYHTFTIARKEDGLMIDKILFIKNWIDFTPGLQLSYAPLFANAENGTITMSPNTLAYLDKRACNVVPSGTTVQLTAVPKPGYVFTGWSGDATGTTNPISVLVTKDREVTANFAPSNTMYTLSTSNLNGTIIRSPNAGSYISTTVVELTAVPNAGYQFNGWSGDATGLTNPVTVTMTANRSVTANFIPLSGQNYSLTINASNGTVTKSPNASTYASGTVVQLTAAPSTGYQFTGWSGAVTGTRNPVSVTMDANKTVTASFAPISQFTLTVNASNGSVTKFPNASSYASGTVVQLTAVPVAGYQFTGWGGAVTGTTNPINITMDANKTVTATFTASGSTTEFCFEAESASGQTGFAPYQVQSDANASGGQYIVVPNGTGNQSAPPSNSIATFTFNVSESGTYYIWMRVIANSSNDNSILIATDGGSYNTYTPGTYTSWTWKKWSSSKNFSTGTHSVSFARNEDGLQLDKIIVTKSTSTPSGMGCSGGARLGLIEESDLASLSISPNPASEEISIGVTIPEEEVATVAVYNSFGQQVDVVWSGMLTNGSHELKYDASALPAGLYYIHFSTGKFSLKRKLVKQ